MVTWDGLVEPSHVAKRNAGPIFALSRLPPYSAYFFGRAKAMISSLVTSEPVRLPPVLTTVTNCL